MNILIKYILSSGIQIPFCQIDPIRHYFPLGLINGEPKLRAISTLKKEYKNARSVTLLIHESGQMKAFIA